MNVLATTAGEHMWNVLMVFGCLIWALGWLSKKVDGDGAIKGAAKKGLVNKISNWLK
jgi:hypothetical protein